MKIPTRPAPEPPCSKMPKQKSLRHVTAASEVRDTCFERFKLARSQSAGKLGETKKPPPRPPPPLKVVTSLKSTPSSRQPSQLLYGLLGRSKGSNKVPKSHSSTMLSEPASCGLLIDLSSPPASPTRSSSDGFSLNSFGSDSHNNANSQVESGFEDDFDSLLMSNSSTPTAADPWSVDTVSKRSLNSVPFELSNEDPRSKHKAVNVTVSVSTKPTIIRAKNLKPARPPPPKLLRPCSTPPSFVSAPLDPPSDWSPPPPNMPPPPPPPEALSGPNLPPRPTSLGQEGEQKKKPYCIALYSYETGHPDDLSFKENDIIYLIEKINDDWLKGTLNNSEGMFPANFVNVVVPLEEMSTRITNNYKYVIALYTFTPETWDDLAFEEGDTVKVLKRINDHWLYGECKGKQGQFPENYVTDVSSFFPLQENHS
ncbi:abl interactor 1 isoform X2 [Macrosteles quadrilineatus]|nr:abl interactor 1 isoform X2 [Macrosteles quadrilineatus]